MVRYLVLKGHTLRTMDLTTSDPEHSPVQFPEWKLRRCPTCSRKICYMLYHAGGVQIRYKKTVEFKKFNYTRKYEFVFIFIIFCAGLADKIRNHGCAK